MSFAGTLVPFLATAVAGDAVFNGGDALFAVFRKDVAHGVLMASITSVGVITVVGMTSVTTCIMVLIQHEISSVIKRSGDPFFRTVALSAGGCLRLVPCILAFLVACGAVIFVHDREHVVVECHIVFPARCIVTTRTVGIQLVMQVACWFGVAGDAVGGHRIWQEGVCKTIQCHCCISTVVVVVAIGAGLTRQFFVKQYGCMVEIGAVFSYIRGLVARDTFIIFNAPKWCMAGRAVVV